LIKSLYDFSQWIYWLLKILEYKVFKIIPYNAVWNGGKYRGKTLTYRLPWPHPIGGCVAGGAGNNV
jgi:hypothetical protein